MQHLQVAAAAHLPLQVPPEVDGLPQNIIKFGLQL